MTLACPVSLEGECGAGDTQVGQALGFQDGAPSEAGQEQVEHDKSFLLCLCAPFGPKSIGLQPLRKRRSTGHGNFLKGVFEECFLGCERRV